MDAVLGPHGSEHGEGPPEADVIGRLEKAIGIGLRDLPFDEAAPGPGLAESLFRDRPEPPRGVVN